jgi:hypothetical protein
VGMAGAEYPRPVSQHRLQLVELGCLGHLIGSQDISEVSQKPLSEIPGSARSSENHGLRRGGCRDRFAGLSQRVICDRRARVRAGYGHGFW